MWVKVNQIYTSHGTQNAWAHLNQGTTVIGWRQIKTGAADGVSNVHLALSAAKVTDRQAHVTIDGSNLITAAYV
jgi:hypothetical protein